MNGALTILAICGLVGCYDIARRMSRHTNHGIRVAIILMGLGCIVTMKGNSELALALMLAGLGLFNVSDRRGHHPARNGEPT